MGQLGPSTIDAISNQIGANPQETKGSDNSTGTVLSDVLHMVKGLSGDKHKGGIGGMLGKLFGKKNRLT